MKYERVTKTKRNNEIKEYYKQHPELSLEEIGKLYGISGSRVHQIVNKKPLIPAT
jgi:DNA-directed RNA polymerase specialized sigma subunit